MKEKELQNTERYIRVGTTLYKFVRRPRINGDEVEDKIVWSYETLRQDYGKNNLPEIEKYDGFCIIPDHINYCQVFGTYLNQYEPISHIPCSGDFPHIRLFLEHIFGSKSSLGLITCNCFIHSQLKCCRFCFWFQMKGTQAKRPFCDF